MIRRAVAAVAVITSILVVDVAPASAFKPSTHLQAAFTAYDDAVDDGHVTIAGVDVPVAPDLLAALRAYPEAYRAGVLGPDAYPDIYVGQAMIHPDTTGEGGAERASTSDDWLRHVWDSAHAVADPDERMEAVAFALGFLTHAAGDVWGHTFVNDFAMGVFPSITDVADAPVAVRHVIVEGYVDHRRPVPTPDPADVSAIEVPDSFITEVFITSEFARTHSAPLHFDAFLDRRDTLAADLAVVERDLAVQDLHPWGFADPFDAPANGLERFYLGVRRGILIDDIAAIDDGLARWPEFSTQIAKAVLAPESDVDAASDAAIRFGFLTVLPMLGVPDAVGTTLLAIRDWYRALAEDVKALFAPIRDLVQQIEDLTVGFLLRNFIDVGALPPEMAAVVDTDGNGTLSLAEFRNLSTTDVLATSSVIISAEERARLDATMALDAPGGTFDPDQFAAYANTVTLSKLAMLDSSGLEALATSLGAPTTSYSDSPDDNIMLGWVGSLDGDFQWRDGSLRAGETGSFNVGPMHFWEDCSTRDSVFRTIFDEPFPGAFADAGDPCT